MAREQGWLEEIAGDTVIVHVKDFDPSIKGVLTGVHSDGLVLRDPIILSENGDTAALESHTAFVLRDQVLFMERL